MRCFQVFVAFVWLCLVSSCRPSLTDPSEESVDVVVESDLGVSRVEHWLELLDKPNGHPMGLGTIVRNTVRVHNESDEYLHFGYADISCDILDYKPSKNWVRPRSHTDVSIVYSSDMEGPTDYWIQLPLHSKLRPLPIEVDLQFTVIWKPVIDLRPRVQNKTVQSGDERVSVSAYLPRFTDGRDVRLREVRGSGAGIFKWHKSFDEDRKNDSEVTFFGEIGGEHLPWYGTIGVVVAVGDGDEDSHALIIVDSESSENIGSNVLLIADRSVRKSVMMPDGVGMIPSRIQQLWPGSLDSDVPFSVSMHDSGTGREALLDLLPSDSRGHRSREYWSVEFEGGEQLVSIVVCVVRTGSK